MVWSVKIVIELINLMVIKLRNHRGGGLFLGISMNRTIV